MVVRVLKTWNTWNVPGIGYGVENLENLPGMYLKFNHLCVRNLVFHQNNFSSTMVKYPYVTMRLYHLHFWCILRCKTWWTLKFLLPFSSTMTWHDKCTWNWYDLALGKLKSTWKLISKSPDNHDYAHHNAFYKCPGILRMSLDYILSYIYMLCPP